MALPTNRDELIQYCLRELGAPVLEINVDDDQIEDRVDEALDMYRDFHSDATERIYLIHEITATDVANQWIPISPDITQVVKLYPVNSSFLFSSNMFSFKYQFALSDFHTLHNFSSGTFSYYEQMRQYLSMLDMKLNGTPQVTFSRRGNKLYIWGDFEDGDIVEGDYIVAEVVQYLPESNTNIWSDRFLLRYTTQLIKRQWGQNMKKFDGMQLPGGVTINGQQLYDEATESLRELKEEMRLEFEEPVDFFVG